MPATSVYESKPQPTAEAVQVSTAPTRMTRGVRADSRHRRALRSFRLREAECGLSPWYHTRGTSAQARRETDSTRRTGMER